MAIVLALCEGHGGYLRVLRDSVCMFVCPWVWGLLKSCFYLNEVGIYVL